MGHGMRLRWLPTPRPLLVLHRRRHGLHHEGYLLTAKVNDAEDLAEFLQRMSLCPTGERAKHLRPILEETARLIRELHRRGLSHRDLKAPNLLVVRQPAAGLQDASSEPLDHWGLTASRVWFIDLVGVRKHARVSRRRKVQNLARLNVSAMQHPALTHSHRLRFLLLYLESGLHGREGWKDWWKAIAAATLGKIRRNLRSGRVLA
jgi:hypothetical protein